MNNKKLTLKKEKIASLSNAEMGNLNGGKGANNLVVAGSTEHNFLCGLCTQVSKNQSCVSLTTCGCH